LLRDGPVNYHPISIEQQLQKSIILPGENIKSGLRDIFILYFITDGQNKLTQFIYNRKQLRIQQYMMPIYKKCPNHLELDENFEYWADLFKDIIRVKRMKVRFFYLDGKDMSHLNMFPTYEKFIFLTVHDTFDFWDQMKVNLKISGIFR
jgi:hypothetical protein